MALSERWFVALLLVATAFGCRRFDVCGTAARPCEPGADAVRLGAAGAGGEGGEGARADCGATRASCDQSTLNGCEADLLSNPRHCGACDNACAGVCAGGSCIPFETRVPEVYEPAANVIVTDEEAFFVARTACCFGPVSLGRYDFSSGAVSWLVRDAWSDVKGIGLSATRVYLIGDYSLYSMARGGGGLRDEGLACDALSVAGTTVAVIASGEAYVRTDDDGEFELIPSEGIPGEGSVDAIAATLSSVYVARDRGSDPGFSLEEHNIVYGEHEVLATGESYVHALHVVDDFTSTYVVTGSESDEGHYALYDLPGLRAGKPLVEFPWDTQWVLTSNDSSIIGRAWIGTYEEGSRTGLRLVTFWPQPFSAEWPTVGMVEGLSASETALWFVEPLGERLVSLDVGDVVDATFASIE